MYSDIKSVQILVTLLKQYNIKRIVCSPGNRNAPIVHSLEQDSFFEIYSVVDERSAAFFGIGLIQHLREPVAICCTSGTAVSNYYSGIVEAYYQKLPLLVISADRNPYYLNHDEEQMLPQTAGFKEVTKCVVQLPMIKDETDEYVCARKINEALLELQHHGCGPVQINIPLESKLADFNTVYLPNVTRIKRYLLKDGWEDCIQKLSKSKILVMYGQAAPITFEEIKLLESFTASYDAVIAVDPLSNLYCEGCISTFMISRIIDASVFLENFCPDIVITLHSGYISYVRSFLKNSRGRFEHWTVNESGAVIDPFSCVTAVFETDAMSFIQKATEVKGRVVGHPYYEKWLALDRKIRSMDDIQIPWSDLRAVQMLADGIPEGAKLHIANSSSVRLISHFDLPSSVEVFCNRGVNGIDGCASAFMGMAQDQQSLCYLLIGDLSFFYDMNSLWNHYVNRNMRIILSNNEGAAIFYYTIGKGKIASLHRNIAAEHHATAKGWVESRGFKYIPVRFEKEMKEAIQVMADQSVDEPVFVEVFTDKEQDAEVMKQFYAKIKKNAGIKSKSGFLKRIIRREKWEY